LSYLNQSLFTFNFFTFSAFTLLISQTNVVEYDFAFYAYFFFFLRYIFFAPFTKISHFFADQTFFTGESCLFLEVYTLIVIIIFTNIALYDGFDLVPLVTFLTNLQLFFQFSIIKTYLSLALLD